MMPDHSIKIEEILLRYEGQAMTPTLRTQIYKEIAPLLGDLNDHVDRQTIFDNKDRKIHLALKAKSPLGKMLLDMLGQGAPEFQ